MMDWKIRDIEDGGPNRHTYGGPSADGKPTSGGGTIHHNGRVLQVGGTVQESAARSREVEQVSREAWKDLRQREAAEAKARAETHRDVTAWGTGPGLTNSDGTRFQGEDYDSAPYSESQPRQSTVVPQSDVGTLFFGVVAVAIAVIAGFWVLSLMG